MLDKTDKTLRILDIYVRMYSGKLIKKVEEAERFGVDERSIQRDIDDIRKFLSNRELGIPGENGTVRYDRTAKGFVLHANKGDCLNNNDILAVCKILLESRAFPKKKIEYILDVLIKGCVPKNSMKLISDLISNEKFHYIPASNSSRINNRIWEMGWEINAQNLLELTYQKAGDTGECIKSIVEPLAIVFSDFYFYLIANKTEKNERGRYEKIYEYPAVYRIDRIVDYSEIGEKFRINYSNRFEEGEFRKRIQFMYQGELLRIRFKYTGYNTEAILDRLPTAKIISKDNGCVLIEAEVYGKGILMWLLSQGSHVEVVSPLSLRNEMKKRLEQMLSLYADK